MGVNLLEIPYTTERHKDWVAMAINLGAGHFAEDIVQEMYLKLATINNPERLLYKGNELNGFYIYTIIKNLTTDLHRAKQKVQTIDILECPEIEYQQFNKELEQEFENKLNLIENEVEKWHWYDKMMFKTYHNSDMSIRTLSKETKISTSSIFNTLKNGKEKIHEAAKQSRTK